MLARRFAFIAIVSLALAACGGGGAAPFVAPATPTPAAVPGAVTFLVVVPAKAPGARQRNVIVPSDATSISFAIESIDGASYSGAPTTETLASSNSSCQSSGGQLSCAFTVNAPPGTVIFTVTVFSGATVLAEGNVSVVTTSGSTVTAPLTLTGTVAKVVMSVGQAVAGVSASLPVTVQAEDSKGNTILGTYSNPIALTDSDASGQTSIATTGTDNPPPGTLISSSDSTTLSYTGGAMSTAAVLGASFTGSSPSNVTSAKFLPIPNWMATSGAVTLGVTYEAAASAENATPAPPAPIPTSTTFPIAIATGQTFNGSSNLVGITGLPSESATDFGGYMAWFVSQATATTNLSSSATSYYAWSPSANGAVLGLVGYSDPMTSSYPELTLLPNPLSLVETCASPYPQQLIVPFPASWKPYAASGTCKTIYTDATGDTDTYAYASDGSYNDSYSLPFGGWAPCPCVTGNQSVTVDSSANVTYSINGDYGVGSITVSAPSPGASTVPVVITQSTASPIMPTPTPLPSSAPNPWLAIGLPNGVPPKPLLQDTMTSKGAIASIPTQCAVPAGLIPSSNPPLTEVDESIVIADPMDDFVPLYTTETIKHYYLNGVGEICNENQTLAYVFHGVLGGFYIGPSGGPPVWSFEPAPGGAIAWYAGYDQNWESFYFDSYTYLTQTTLVAVQARIHDFTKVMPTATQALTAATYSIAHTPSIRGHHAWSRVRPAWAARPAR